MTSRASIIAGTAVFAVAISVAGAAGAQENVVISKAGCQRLVAHVPAGNVGYQAGVDAYGRSVAPGDLGGGYPGIKAPDEISFNIEVTLRNFVGGPAANASAASAAVTAADKATTATAFAATAADQADAAAAANPGNFDLVTAAKATRAAANKAATAVTAVEQASAASAAAAAAGDAAAADPGNDALANAAAAAEAGAEDASAAATALTDTYISAARVGQFLGRPVIGRIRVRGDQVYFNDRPLLNEEQAKLSAACQKILKSGR